MNLKNLFYLKRLKMNESLFNHQQSSSCNLKTINNMEWIKKLKLSKEAKINTDHLLCLKSKFLKMHKNLILLNKYLSTVKKVPNRKKSFRLIKLEVFSKSKINKCNKCNKLKLQILKKSQLKEFSLLLQKQT